MSLARCEEEITSLAMVAAADLEAGRYVMVTDQREHRALMEDIVAQLRARHANKR